MAIPLVGVVAFESDASHELRVCTIEDIIAEKLRALLQQPIRNRRRRQDLLDIAVTLQNHPEIDRGNVSRFLVRKAEARDVYVSRSAFRKPEVAQRAEQDYDELRADARGVRPIRNGAGSSLLFRRRIGHPGRVAPLNGTGQRPRVLTA